MLSVRFVYYSSTDNKWSESFDQTQDRRGEFSLGKFNVTFDCFCGLPVGTLVDSTGGVSTSGPPGTVFGGVRVNLDVIPLRSAPIGGDLDPV